MYTKDASYSRPQKHNTIIGGNMIYLGKMYQTRHYWHCDVWEKTNRGERVEILGSIKKYKGHRQPWELQRPQFWEKGIVEIKAQTKKDMLVLIKAEFRRLRAINKKTHVFSARMTEDEVDALKWKHGYEWQKVLWEYAKWHIRDIQKERGR